MRLFTQIRALVAMIVLASHSPVGLALGQLETDWGAHVAHMGISLFVGRFTRVAAAQQFEPTQTGISRCPSRFVLRAIAAMKDCAGSPRSLFDAG